MKPANDNRQAANDNEPPRLLNKSQAAAYCGATLPTFGKWIARGLIPKALPMRRWDRKALDLALDKMSGLIVESAPKESALEKWRREHKHANKG
jgi:hypothetical protein